MFNRGDRFLYMKVGVHAQEELADIVARKRQEIEDTGMALWGYGGNTCHPLTAVQPFAQATVDAGAPIVLAMEAMDSNHMAVPERSVEYSSDKRIWLPIPREIDVRGSTFALCLSSLEEVDLELALPATRVAVGKCAGRPGDEYIKGRVDKACLEMGTVADYASAPSSISLVADLAAPFAVFLR